MAPENFIIIILFFNIAYIIISEFLFLKKKLNGKCTQGNYTSER
jgi:hypothetical protein